MLFTGAMVRRDRGQEMATGPADAGAQGTLFEERFLGRYAGAIMADPTVALVELVANAWDAYATSVNIQWPSDDSRIPFSIRDDGIGMTQAEFEFRWRVIDYDRTVHQGLVAAPPPGVVGLPRPVYGRNGKGRLAGFLFSTPYRVRTWKDGREATYLVSQGKAHPIKCDLENVRNGVPGHGTEISAVHVVPTSLSADEARSILSTRFLTNPSFRVSVDGVLVTFRDVPPDCLDEFDVDVPGYGTAQVMVIDSQRTDRSTKQHGVAWWVNRRLVGHTGWRLSDQAIIDGRTEAAKRFTFIVKADFLGGAVLPDWSDFRTEDAAWRAAEPAVQAAICEILADFTKERRARVKEAVQSTHRSKVRALPVVSRERWALFLEQLVEQCPNLAEHHVEQIMGLLANMEAADSRYELLGKLHALAPDQIDEWNAVMEKWTISTAKVVLDEVERRLRIIEELRVRTTSTDSDEVQDLQPLFKRALWIFGPQFESIEFTSNQGMTSVIKKLYGGEERGSRNRPDFAISPDSTVGFYSRPAFDEEFNEIGTDTLVIVELKKPGVRIGTDEKGQVWKYVTELMDAGHVTDDTRVYGWVLGDSIHKAEARERKEGDRVIIRPLLYSAFIGQAEKRMMNLQNKLLEAPFMKQALAELRLADEDASESRQGELEVAFPAPAT
ncbi:MAG: ATP-binding protein [Acetobacteraceae bacterium]|nr:ATP-binding protein [Acetobacteraceae bacterium]